MQALPYQPQHGAVARPPPPPGAPVVCGRVRPLECSALEWRCTEMRVGSAPALEVGSVALRDEDGSGAFLRTLVAVPRDGRSTIVNVQLGDRIEGDRPLRGHESPTRPTYRVDPAQQRSARNRGPGHRHARRVTHLTYRGPHPIRGLDQGRASSDRRHLTMSHWATVTMLPGGDGVPVRRRACLLHL